MKKYKKMACFWPQNFGDPKQGLYEDIATTIQKHALFCICCLEKNVPYINLSTCSHSDFLNNFAKSESKAVNQVICYQCHAMLKKIELFKLQVEESFKLLEDQAINLETKTNNRQLRNLKVHKAVDIGISHSNPKSKQRTNLETQNNNNKSTIDDIEETQKKIENCNTKNKTKNAQPSEEDRKMKNIETALKIINSNKNFDTFNLLAASIKSIASNHLPVIAESLLGENVGEKENVGGEENDTQLPVTEMKTQETETVPEVKIPSKRSNIKTIKLTKEELKEERSRLAELETYLKCLYRCESCLLGFLYKENLDDHINRKHMPKPGGMTCDVCLQVQDGPESQYEHNVRHYTRYECVACSKRFGLYDEAADHYKKEHAKAMRYKCDQCSYATNYKKKFGCHMYRNHCRYSCPNCTTRFRTLRNLRTHTHLIHEKIPKIQHDIMPLAEPNLSLEATQLSLWQNS